jgi:hypothetical protein
MQFSADIRESLSFHGFTLDTHVGPLFFLKLRVKHPSNPLLAGTASENSDGQVTNPPLTMPIIASILDQIFTHHVSNGSTQALPIQLVQLNELRPDLSTAQQDQTYFMLVFRLDPDVPDTPNPMSILEQLRTIVLSDWLHFSATDIRNHRTNNTTTTRPLEYKTPEWRLLLTRPIPSPWIPYLDLYLPACNAIADRSLGILTGLPVTIPPLNTNQRLLFHLMDQLLQLFDPFLPDIFKDPFLRHNIIGIRSGKFTAPGQSKPQFVAYISATSQQIFNLFFNAQQKYLNSIDKLCINLYGFQVRVVSAPNTRSREDQTIRARIYSTAAMLHNNLQ